MATQSLIIIPFGQIQREILEFLRIELSQIFSLDVTIAKSESIPQYAFDPKRRQYLDQNPGMAEKHTCDGHTHSWYR